MCPKDSVCLVKTGQVKDGVTSQSHNPVRAAACNDVSPGRDRSFNNASYSTVMKAANCRRKSISSLQTGKMQYLPPNQSTVENKTLKWPKNSQP